MLTSPIIMDSLLPHCALPLPPSASLSSTYSCNSPFTLLEQLADPFNHCLSPLASMDLLPSMPSPSAPPSKKRKFLPNHLICGDYHASVNAAYGCDDLEDVLNFLWIEDHVSASADASLQASSEQFPLFRGSDWDYCSNDSSFVAESSNEDPITSAGGDQHNSHSNQAELQEDLSTVAASPPCIHVRENSTLRESWQKTERVVPDGTVETAGDRRSGAWQLCNEEDKLLKRGSSWWHDQQRLQGGVKINQRGSWQDGLSPSLQDGGASKVSWQGEGIVKTSWQDKQASRASWQAPASKVASAVPSCSGNADQWPGGSWAGPTLLDIESALALSSVSCSNNSNIATSCSGPPTPSSSTTDPKHTISPLLDVKAILLSGDPPQQDNLGDSWRLKLQKRSSQEPKYSIKVDSEEKALADGYRWRKYGQKSIKNSPFPRSYYRCSSGKCIAKKQVEKCQDEGLFLVTYEGIHLHHKPNLLLKFRMARDLHEDDKEKFPQCEKVKSPSSPSSSTSFCHLIPTHD